MKQYARPIGPRHVSMDRLGVSTVNVHVNFTTMLTRIIFGTAHNNSEMTYNNTLVSKWSDTQNGRVIEMICFYIKMTIIVVGILGNSISLAEFIRYRISASNVGYYLICLAASDNFVLLLEIFIWMVEPPLEVVLIDKYDSLCRLTYFFKYTFRIWSANLTLAVTLERYLFVAHPLKKTYFQKHRIHRILIPLSLFLSGACVVYSLFLIKVQRLEGGTAEMCSVVADKRMLFMTLDLIMVRGIADAFVGALIMILTLLCISVLRKAEKLRRNGNMQEMSSLCSSCGNQIHRIHQKGSKSRESQITKMLIIIAVMFVVFKIPYTVFYYSTFTWQTKTSLSLFEMVLKGAKSLSEALGLISYAFNFFVYIMVIPSFRERIGSVLSCQCCRRERE